MARLFMSGSALYYLSQPGSILSHLPGWSGHLQEILYPVAFERVIPVRVNHKSLFGLFLNDEVFFTFTESILGRDRDQAGFGPLGDTGNDRVLPGDLYIDCL